MFSIIAAVAEDGAIGKNNDLLWDIPEDLKFFKETTKHSAIIMGYKTFLSINSKPLPKRLNIVLTNDKTHLENDFDNGLVFVTSIRDAMNMAEQWRKERGLEQSFFIGGGFVYAQALDIVNKMYITEVVGSYPEADVFFPKFDKTEWDINIIQENEGYSFLEYNRRVK